MGIDHNLDMDVSKDIFSIPFPGRGCATKGAHYLRSAQLTERAAQMPFFKIV